MVGSFRDLSVAETVSTLQEMIDEGTVTVKKTDENSVLNNEYVITDFGHWLLETKIMYQYHSADHEGKQKIREQYERR